jgi:hypothetical protein
MSENTNTAPGHAIVIKTATAPPEGTRLTSHTSVADFEKVKHLLSDKPLRPPVRPQHI